MKKIIVAVITIISSLTIAQAKILNSQQFDMAFENYLNNHPSYEIIPFEEIGF